MKPITFCIATAKNEKEYVKLLIRSLQENTQINNHEILVFIDSDNQDTHGALLEIKKTQPNLRVCKNPNKYPVGGQRNISVMFNAASNNIVCYLQSDMVVGKNFDQYITDSLTSDKVLVCGTRVEPPIHPPSADKYTQNFGLDTTDFKYDQFNTFVAAIQQQKKQDTQDYSVPFALYKSTWLEVLGGYDTQFRCSHEDIDSVARMHLAGILIKQNWKAIVYHFTCVSSRGVNWFMANAEADYKNEIQQLASQEEAKRYLRKWGTHDRKISYRYRVGLILKADRYINPVYIKQIEPYYDIIQIESDPVAVDQIVSQLTFEADYYSNIRWNYTPDHWAEVRHLFNQTDFRLRVTTNPIDLDIIVSCNYSDLLIDNQQSVQLAQSIQRVIHENDPGNYELGRYQITIRQKYNCISDLIKCTNTQAILDAQSLNFL